MRHNHAFIKGEFVFLNRGKVMILREDPAAGDRYIIEDREQNMMHSYRLFELQGHRSTANMDSTCRIFEPADMDCDACDFQSRGRDRSAAHVTGRSHFEQKQSNNLGEKDRIAACDMCNRKQKKTHAR